MQDLRKNIRKQLLQRRQVSIKLMNMGFELHRINEAIMKTPSLKIHDLLKCLGSPGNIKYILHTILCF